MFSVSDDCHAHGSAHDIKHKNTYEFPEEKILAEEKRNMRIAFVGVGNISEIYLENITNMFREIGGHRRLRSYPRACGEGCRKI